MGLLSAHYGVDYIIKELESSMSLIELRGQSEVVIQQLQLQNHMTVEQATNTMTQDV